MIYSTWVSTSVGPLLNPQIEKGHCNVFIRNERQWSSIDPASEYAEAESRLIGPHQAGNAASAVAAASLLHSQGFSHISSSCIKAGLETVSLPGRFQVGLHCNIAWRLAGMC